MSRAIWRLAQIDSITGAAQFPIGVQDQDYRISASTLLQFIIDNLPADAGVPFVTPFVTQYASPSSTGFSVAINNNSSNTHLILTPTAGFAAGTLVLPAVANVIDKQDILVNCTQQVTTLTINGNGAGAVTGEPSSLAADDFFRLKYDLPTSTWYRVG